jgi:hypothetical protein
MSEQAYPLCWPAGWPRHSGQRERGAFDGSFDKVRRRLVLEIERLMLGKEATRWHTPEGSIILSTNMPLRRDGSPYASAAAPQDPGVAVYFVRKKKPVCFACDKYDAVWKNLRAIQKTIEALRGIERWGSSQLLDRAFTGFAALPEKTQANCWEVLGIEPAVATEAKIMEAWRAALFTAHPDHGGSSEALMRLNEAKDIALSTARNGGAR